jgi:hypothetical protein
MFEFVFGDPQLSAQQWILLIRDLIEIARRDQQRGIAAWCIRVELAQLQLDAFTHRTRANSRWIHRLNVPENTLQIRNVRNRFWQQIACDFFERLDDIAIVIDGIDNRGANAPVAFTEPRHFQLPGEMFLKGFTASVGKLLRVIVR